MKTAHVDLPLHYGKSPEWLFKKMIKLAGPISEVIILEYGKDEFLKRLSDPYFFQSLGCVVGFDWHSSGLTTTLTAALKEYINQKNLGIVIAGGKGKISRKTPEEIKFFSEKFNLSEMKKDKLVYVSRIAAKVDNSMLQDGYDLYHHTFIFTEEAKWSIIQQGMNDKEGYARRYHWLSDNVKKFVEEPHLAIFTQRKEEKVLDLTSKNSRETREVSLDIAKENPIHFKKFNKRNIKEMDKQKNLYEFYQKIKFPKSHGFKIDLGNYKILQKIYEIQPENYEEMLMIRGVGKKTLRALSLISSIIYGTKLSWKDPAIYSYAHGGKDGIPYPVNKEIYEQSVEILKQAVEDAKIGNKEKLKILKKIKVL